MQIKDGHEVSRNGRCGHIVKIIIEGERGNWQPIAWVEWYSGQSTDDVFVSGGAGTVPFDELTFEE